MRNKQHPPLNLSPFSMRSRQHLNSHASKAVARVVGEKAVQSVFFAGGGVKRGTVIGASDRIGAYPSVDPQKPEYMAATICQALGLPQRIAWKDSLARSHHVCHGEPIHRLT